jgi:NADH dehydrogenase FAD-containing subunit
LTQFEESLQQVAMNNFSGRVNVVVNARVIDVSDDKVTLKDGRQLSYGLLVWAAGNGKQIRHQSV